MKRERFLQFVMYVRVLVNITCDRWEVSLEHVSVETASFFLRPPMHVNLMVNGSYTTSNINLSQLYYPWEPTLRICAVDSNNIDRACSSGMQLIKCNLTHTPNGYNA